MSTSAYTEQQSERWLLERTYHAQLRNGRTLSVPDLTRAIKELIDCSIAFSTWQEISPEEAGIAYHYGEPILLYSECAWTHVMGDLQSWMPNKNMHTLIYGDMHILPDVISGTEYAVCYLDTSRGHYMNTSWKKRFVSDLDTILTSYDLNVITFFRPCLQFPSTIHYTVITSDGQTHEYRNRAEAIEGFMTFSLLNVENGNQFQTIFPQFCYYHEIICPDGIYRLEFLGPRMDEQGYLLKTTAHS